MAVDSQEPTTKRAKLQKAAVSCRNIMQGFRVQGVKFQSFRV